jgi:hypothetical protein
MVMKVWQTSVSFSMEAWNNASTLPSRYNQADHILIAHEWLPKNGSCPVKDDNEKSWTARGHVLRRPNTQGLKKLGF